MKTWIWKRAERAECLWREQGRHAFSLSDEQLDKTQCATVQVSKMYNLRNGYYKNFKGHYIQLTVWNLNTLPFSHYCALRGLS